MSKVRALGRRGSRGLLRAAVDGAGETCGSESKDRRLAPKPPLLSANIAQGDRGASSCVLVGRRLPAYVLLLVPKPCVGRRLES